MRIFVYNVIMQRGKFLLVLLSCLALTSCGTTKPEYVDEDPKEEEETNSLFTGGLVDDGIHIGYEFSKKNPVRPTSGIGEVEIFGINDFHGAILPKDATSEAAEEAGLAKLATFIKEQTAQENVLFFDQGDTWQGSLESNHNYGKLIQSVFKDSGISLRTLGNHDFDWGIDQLKETNASAEIPTLCANVYNFDWETKKVGETQQRDLGKEYATFVMDNGIKVGVVGVIGDDQITSITTQYVKNISFTNHIEKIKEISNYLRTNKNCDLVVASVHGDYEQTMSKGLTKISPVTNERYVDLVMNAHTHRNQVFTENNVIFSQWGRNGEYTGSVTLKYDFSNNKVINSTISDDRTSYNAKYLRTFYPENDKEIDMKISDYLREIESVSSEVLSTKFSGTFTQDENLPYLMAEAIYEECQNQDLGVDISVVNYARSAFTKSTMTYSDLYTSFPFDNEIILMKVKGYDCVESMKHNMVCHDEDLTMLRYDTEYTMACIDFLALHCDDHRKYDTFPSSQATEIGVLKVDNNPITYREVLRKYLLNHPEKTFTSSDYTYQNPKFYL